MIDRKKLEQYIRENSGLEVNRPYIGLSGIGDCPLVMYRNYQDTMDPSYNDHRNAFRGYTMEREVENMLLMTGQGKTTAREISLYGGLVKGHVDMESMDSKRLVEIKSYAKFKFDAVIEEKKLPARAFKQVHAYMKYGEYKGADVVIICPETFELITMEFSPLPQLWQGMERKLEALVKDVRDGKVPACECGKCKINKTPGND